MLSNMTTNRYSDLLLRVVCALALLGSVFVHNAAARQSANTVDLSTFILPDGTVPVLCSSDSHERHSQLDGFCKFCLTSDIPDLSATEDKPLIMAPEARDVRLLLRPVNALRSGQTAFGPRGPPVRS